MPESPVPERGDVLWLSFSPQAGHEQAGRRPAVVLSPATCNRRMGFALLCPITTRVKGSPFELALPDRLPVQGVVLSDQVKSLDCRARRAELASRLSGTTMRQILEMLTVLTTDEYR